MAEELERQDESSPVALGQRYGVPFIDLTTFRVDGEVLSMFTEDFLRRNEVCPLFRSGNVIAVAMVDPGDIFVMDEVRRMTGLEVEPFVCREIDQINAINQFYTQGAAPDIPDESDDLATSLEPDADGKTGSSESSSEPKKLEEGGFRSAGRTLGQPAHHSRHPRPGKRHPYRADPGRVDGPVPD